MTFASITLPCTQVRWRLDGPAGVHLDTVVAALIGAGVEVEAIKPATAYRLRGSAELLDVLGAELSGKVEGFTLAREMPPAGTVNMRSTLTDPHAFRRSFTVHGEGGSIAASFCARAVDRGMTVAPTGIGRWTVTARSADLVQWLADIYVKTPDEVLEMFNWSAESISAEDAAAPAVSITLPPLQVAVTLPDRKTVSTVTRDADGDIKTVIAIETDATP